MALPDPIPDNPKRWEGWRNYNSDDLYQRLCLSFDSNPSNEQIEDHCRRLLVWWQKKLPLKNQPSNPVAQMLRAGLDDAPQYLAEARTKLLDPAHRARIDNELRAKARVGAFEELSKFLIFATAAGTLSDEDEKNLYQVGIASGLSIEEMKPMLDAEIEKRGLKRINRQEMLREQVAAATAAAPKSHAQALSPFDEFRRMIRLSGLSDDDMTDDQRDALCNMGENLGLTGGQAEDLIDEYLEEVSGVLMSPPGQAAGRQPVPAKKPLTLATPSAASRPGASKSGKTDEGAQSPAEPAINLSPLARAREKEKYPTFTNSVGMEMLLIPTGMFSMGSTAADAGPTEQPVTRVTLTCFYLSRFPVTNEQYEQFDPSHSLRRMPSADGRHPVVYVSSEEAERFCKWLGSRDRKTYRLPTEAEWEYAARGSDGRTFPWGEKLGRGDLANFADRNTSFAWRDSQIDDGYAETSPVGNYPRGASAFGVEDMAGNVWEWCLDFFENYKGKDRINPRGPHSGTRRMYRGGSWKSRGNTLRAAARGFNLPNFSANDVGFRVVCECV